MKDVKHVNYTQLDHKVDIVGEQGVIILTSLQAYEQFAWCREYFSQQPQEGYFIWVKRSQPQPITTSIVMCSQYVTQNSLNLVVVEQGVQAEMINTCAAQRGNLYGKHIGHTKIVVKENARFKVKHVHSWGKDDTVSSNLELTLKRGSEVSYSQRCHHAPLKLTLENNNYLDEYASLNYAATVLSEQGQIEMYDDTYLNGRKSNGISRVKMIARENTRLHAQSRMFANAAGTGHLDCMGLLLGDNSDIVAIPELINKNRDASLTHEASVGKISEEVLNYLRSRGLTEDEAIDLVVTGFLGEEENVVIDGVPVSSKTYM